MMVRYASDDLTIEEGAELNVGALNYTFADGIEGGSAAFEARGFQVDVAGFVNLSGDIGVSSAANGDIVVVGNNVGARLGTTNYNVAVANADFGLISNDDGTTFELNGGDLSSDLGPLGSFSLGTAAVVYSSEGMSVDAGTNLRLATPNTCSRTTSATILSSALGFVALRSALKTSSS